MVDPFSYAIVTPARNEVETLPRLARCLDEQTLPPTAWVVIENGSIDETFRVAQDLALNRTWMRVLSIPAAGGVDRGAPIVRALHAGLAALVHEPQVVVSLDADVSMERTYFEGLLAKFAEDTALGIASGICYEQQPRGGWRQRHGTGGSVWGASRAYRWECLLDVLPFEARVGWDGIDQHKANMRGWKTETFLDLPFRHHRKEGERDRSRHATWAAQGRLAHYMDYRVWYLGLRAVNRARQDPAALAMLWGYASAALHREMQCGDEELRAHVRSHQSMRKLPGRVREALRPRNALG